MRSSAPMRRATRCAIPGPDRIEGTLKTPLDGKSRLVATRVAPDISKELDAAREAGSDPAVRPVTIRE